MPPVSTEPVVEYFTAERQGAWFLIAFGLAAMAFAVVLWTTRSAFVALAWPLVVLGAFELVVGTAIVIVRASRHGQQAVGGIPAADVVDVPR